MSAYERDQLELVADQYRADGYHVVVEPQPADLPEFLRRFRIDLIAERGEEHVVVEVSLGDPSDAKRAACAYRAAEVNSRPNWRFDLFVVGRDDAPSTVPDSATELGPAQIQSQLEQATRLLHSGELQAACLVAWAATEAALREVARREGVELERTTPLFVLKTLFAEGLIDRTELARLQSAMRIRNALAHGYEPEGLDASVASGLIDTARNLLQIEPSKQDA